MLRTFGGSNGGSLSPSVYAELIAGHLVKVTFFNPGMMLHQDDRGTDPFHIRVSSELARSVLALLLLVLLLETKLDVLFLGSSL